MSSCSTLPLFLTANVTLPCVADFGLTAMWPSVSVAFGLDAANAAAGSAHSATAAQAAMERAESDMKDPLVELCQGTLTGPEQGIRRRSRRGSDGQTQNSANQCAPQPRAARGPPRARRC